MTARSDLHAEAARSNPSGERILGYDLARALALLGMIVVHFGLVLAADTSRPAWAAAIMQILDGRATATFVVLAGIGLTLITRRAQADPSAAADVRRVLIRRGVFLLLLGMANLVIWPGDILRVYGVSLIVAAGLVTASNRRLLASALAFVAGFLLLFFLLDYERNWEWATMTYRGLGTAEGIVRNLFFDGFRSVFPWTGLILFGMWLGRLDLRDRAINARVAIVGVLVAAFAELTSRALIAYFLVHRYDLTVTESRWLFGTESMPPLPLFLLAAGGTAVAVIAACVRAAEASRAARWLTMLAATGQMALTWYVAHILIGLGTVSALGLVASQSLPAAQAWGVAFFAAAALASVWWKKRFRHGPLEWVMRRVAG